jgi:hypothetical protein
VGIDEVRNLTFELENFFDANWLCVFELRVLENVIVEFERTERAVHGSVLGSLDDAEFAEDGKRAAIDKHGALFSFVEIRVHPFDGNCPELAERFCDRVDDVGAPPFFLQYACE